ncbi:unnamed protein product [Citrullus colocynthis]|uniref:Uncharacterized protein n=1 Tax=Citrullus colocynthis TaxID=252529 RepID=A0ABP0XT80_9ROSI
MKVDPTRSDVCSDPNLVGQGGRVGCGVKLEGVDLLRQRLHVVLPALQCGQHKIATCKVTQGALHQTRACIRPLLE